MTLIDQDFSGGTVVKNLPFNARGAGDGCSTPGLGRAPGGNGNPGKYSCLENSMYREPNGLQSVESQRVQQD